MGHVAEAGLAALVKTRKQIGHAVEPVVVAGEIRELCVEDVEDEVIGKRMTAAIGEAGSDEFSGPHGRRCDLPAGGAALEAGVPAAQDIAIASVVLG